MIEEKTLPEVNNYVKVELMCPVCECDLIHDLNGEDIYSSLFKEEDDYIYLSSIRNVLDILKAKDIRLNNLSQIERFRIVIEENY